MSRKGIILSLVIFIGLGLYVFLVEKKKPLLEGKEVILKLDKLDKDKIQRLTLGHDGKEIILNKGKEGKWQITSPLITKADDEVIKGMVDDLSNLEASQSLEVNPAEWEDFGLKKPGIEVALSIEGRGEEKLSFGDKNPAGTSIYTRLRGKDKVFLVSSYLANGFKKEIFDLRDKVILSLDRDKIDKIELIYPPGKSLVLERDKDKKWFATGKERTELDSDKVNDLLWELTDLKAKGIVAGEIKDLVAYGLDKPEVKAVITSEGKEKVLLLGNKAAGPQPPLGTASPEEGVEGVIYASLVGDLRLFLVEASLSSRLKKDLSELKKAPPPAAETGPAVKPASEGSAGKK